MKVVKLAIEYKRNGFSFRSYYYFVSKGLLGPPTKFTTLSPKNVAESIW
jgi:hypothetical protein